MLLINRLSDCIADFYVEKNIILPNEKEVYKFGVELVLNEILTFLLILIFSAVFVKFRYGVEFLLTFCLTRMFAGGYHARKAYLCRLSMLAVAFFVFFAATKASSISLRALSVLLAVSMSVVIPFVPVKHPNKELTDKLIKRGKIGTILMYVLYCALSIVLFLHNSITDAVVIALSLSAVSVLVIIGNFTNERSECE